MAETDKKSILITGGSRGIGRATALLAGARGWKVAVNYRSDRAMAERTARELEAAGGAACALQGDVAEEIDAIRIFDEAEAAFGQLDGVVVNAGITGPPAALADMSAERITRLIMTNVLGSMFTAREAARRLPRPAPAASASIVIVSSVAAKLGSPNEYVDYAVSKAGLDILTIGLAKELGEKNVRVNAVRPGIIRTDIHASGGQPDRAERLGKTVPLARSGGPEEVAEAIVWLLSDAASYTTGANIDVAGGR